MLKKTARQKELERLLESLSKSRQHLEKVGAKIKNLNAVIHASRECRASAPVHRSKKEG